MKRKKVNSKIEEKIITAMITSNEFLGQVAGIETNLFTADHFRIVAKWCISYFNKYHKAPQEHIEIKYHSWVEKGKAKEETVDAIHDILEKLSDNYEQGKPTNIPYLLDEASKHFSLQKIELLRDNLELSLYEKDISIADNALNSHCNAKITGEVGVRVFQDRNALKIAFSDSQEPLFSIGSKDVQRFFGPAFCRDNLIAVLAPEKRGKTFWCVEFAIRALMARRKVALFEVGDMSQSQILKRIAVRFAGQPMFKNQCGKISIPTAIRRRNGKTQVQRKNKIVESIITEKSANKAMDEFMKSCPLSPKKEYFMTSAHPNSSVNVSDIFGILNKWENEKDFVPDVIIIDYADILANEPGTGNYSTRDKANETWKALRRLSQEKHCLVIVPTQADAASYDQYVLTAKNFSEDKRKLGHVTGMLGLNQMSDEKKAGIMRLNWIVLREAPFSINRFLYVGQCLPLARSYCCGYF